MGTYHVTSDQHSCFLIFTQSRKMFYHPHSTCVKTNSERKNSLLVVRAKLLQSCLTLFNPIDCSPPGSSVHGDSPGKNTGVGCHVLLQRIFPTQGLNMRLYVSCSGTQVLYKGHHLGSLSSHVVQAHVPCITIITILL